MMYENEPENFNPIFNIASCIIEYNGKMLLLHRKDSKPEGGTWGEPAGKIKKTEGIHDAVIREVFEETKISLINPVYHKKYFVRFPKYDFVFYSFHKLLDKPENVVLNRDEHKDFLWISPIDALKLPLITDEDLRIKLFYGFNETL